MLSEFSQALLLVEPFSPNVFSSDSHGHKRPGNKSSAGRSAYWARQKGRHSTRHVAIQAFSLRGWVFFCSPVGRGQKGPLFSHGFSQIKHGLTPSASVKIREDLWLLPAEPTREYSPRSIPAGLGAEAPQKLLWLSPATAVPHSSRTPYFSNSSRGSTWLNKFRITASRLTYGTRPSSLLH